MDRKVIADARAYIERLFADNADGHDLNHTLRVYKNATLIALRYVEVDWFVLELAALLHDVDDHKLFRTENNANARSFLLEQNVDQDTIDRICHVINTISFSKNRGKKPDSLEGKIVQDADRLDAIGAIGIARTFAYGGRMGRPLDSSIEHFHAKLLLLKDEMNTEEGRKMALQRHEFMLEFLQKYRDETEL